MVTPALLADNTLIDLDKILRFRLHLTQWHSDPSCLVTGSFYNATQPQAWSKLCLQSLWLDIVLAGLPAERSVCERGQTRTLCLPNNCVNVVPVNHTDPRILRLNSDLSNLQRELKNCPRNMNQHDSCYAPLRTKWNKLKVIHVNPTLQTPTLHTFCLFHYSEMLQTHPQDLWTPAYHRPNTHQNGI